MKLTVIFILCLLLSYQPTLSSSAPFIGHTHNIDEVIKLSDGRIWTISHNELFLWDTQGQLLKVMDDNRDISDWGNWLRAKEVSSGYLIIWDEKRIQFWNNDGDLLNHIDLNDSPFQLVELANQNIAFVTNYAVIVFSPTGDLINQVGVYITRITPLMDGGFMTLREDKRGAFSIWNADTSLRIQVDAHTSPISILKQLGNGNILTSGYDNSLALWRPDGTHIATMEGHTNTPTRFIELRNGNIVTWSDWEENSQNVDDFIPRLWDENGVFIRALVGHSGLIKAVQQLDDGRLISWGNDADSRLWDEQARLLTVMSGHQDNILLVRQLSDGRLLSMSQDEFRFWDANGKFISAFRNPPSEFGDILHELHNGRIIKISGTVGDTIHVWDNQGELLAAISGLPYLLQNLVYLDNNRYLVWGMGTPIIQIIDFDDTSNYPLNIMVHSARVEGAKQLRDERILSWSNDHTLALWDIDGNLLKRLIGHTGWVRGAVQLPDNTLLSWSKDGTMRVWDIEGNLIRIIEAHTDFVSGVLLLSSGHILSWGQDGKQLGSWRLWDVDGTLLKQIEGDPYEASAKELRDGRLLLWQGSVLYLYDAELHLLAHLVGHGYGSIRDVLELRDGRLLSWGNDYTLHLWDSHGAPLAELTEHDDVIAGAIELMDSHLVSWASADNSIWLRDADGTAIKELDTHPGGIKGVMQQSSGRLVTWGAAGLIYHWEANGTLLGEWANLGINVTFEGFYQLANDHLLLWDRGGTLYLWDDEGTLIRRMNTGHSHYIVNTLMLSNSHLLSWSADGTLALWDI